LVLHEDTYIIYVGYKEITKEFREHPKIIIARNLPYNIENKPKLLTFTAWYLIIKNNLFESYEHICLIEYDLILNKTFKDDLSRMISDSHPDVISFTKPISNYFFRDVSIKILNDFLYVKRINNNIIKNIIWSPSTNYCIRRNILSDFVNWYYPDCIYIEIVDYSNFSWYHERLFSVYLKYKNIITSILEGPIHKNMQSHYININEKIRLSYDDSSRCSL
jgi:hypothetical protein